MLFTDANIEKLRKVVDIFKKYDKVRDKTRLDKALAKNEEEFSQAYPEINLKRSNEINPLTACAHGTNAGAVLFGIMFSGGQLLPLNGVKQARVLNMRSCHTDGNRNFVSTVHLENTQDFRNKYSDVIAEISEERKQIIHRDFDEVTFSTPRSFARGVKVFYKDIFLNRISERCKNDKSIHSDMLNALDNDVLQIFEKFQKIPVIIIGHGIGKYEGHIPLTANAPRETLFKKFNMAILAVKKEYMKPVKFLTKINPDLKIFVIDQEELLKFTDEYNTQFYDKSTTDKKNKYYNTDCDNITSESFIKALFNRFKPPLTFSEEVPPVTITERSIYNKDRTKRNRLCYRLDRVSYCAKGVKQRQEFYDEGQIKDAIKKGEKIGDYDPIVYALLHGILLENKFPLIYAMENAIKIEGIDPTVWAENNKYDVDVKEKKEKEPIAYAIEHAIKIEGKDPVLWAQENKHKVDRIDPIVYAIKQFGVIVNKEVVYKTIKIEGKDAKEWISNAIKKRQKIGDKDVEEWLIDAIKEATEKGGFNPLYWRNYPSELVDCAEENNIILDRKPVREWLRDKEVERENPNEHTTKDTPNPTLVVPTSEEDSQPEENLLQNADQDPTVEVPSLTVNIHEVYPQPKAETIMTKLPISGADLKSQINDIFPMSQKRYGFENYQSGKGLVELSKERVDIVNKYIESIEKDFIEPQFFLKIRYAQLCIECELRCLKINGNTLLLKEYLEIVKQYNGWVSSIFDKYEKWDDALRDRNEKINRELATIEEILSSKTQKNEHAAEVLQLEPEEPEAEEDPSPTVLMPEEEILSSKTQKNEPATEVLQSESEKSEAEEDPSPTVGTPTTNSTSNQLNPQNCFPKLNWLYIGICSSVCLGLGLVIAGALGLTGGVAAAAIVGSIIFGAIVGGLIGTCVSDTEVSQPNNGLGRE